MQALGKDIVRVTPGELAIFAPERYRLHVAGLDFTIEEARRLCKWPELEEAVDAKIAEQQRFIAWRAHVIRGVGQPKNGDRSVTKLSDREITEISGITKKQAESLATKLAQPEKYREHLLGAGYCAAFLSPLEGVRGTTGTGDDEWFTPVGTLNWRAPCSVRSISTRRRMSRRRRSFKPRAISQKRIMGWRRSGPVVSG